MGLLQVAAGSLNTILADQWREYFICEAMGDDVLVRKGTKRKQKQSGNTRGTDDIITNGSVIAVNEGQCMLIVDQGAIVEVSAEPGQFVWDSSTEPSIFYGGLGQGMKQSFETWKRRVGFGGDTGTSQRVYFINTKSILGNKYGTAAPIPYRVVDHNIGLDMDIAIRCHGEYAYHIVDPILFYRKVSTNVSDEYNRSQLDPQLKSELLKGLNQAFARISEMGIRYSALPGHVGEIADALNAELSKTWGANYGIEIVPGTFGVSSVTASEEDEAMIKELQKTGALRRPDMGAAYWTQGTVDAMKTAAGNTSAGPMMGFMGMGMANMMGGQQAANLYGMAQGMPNQGYPQQGMPGQAYQQAGYGQPGMQAGAAGYQQAPQEPPKMQPQGGWTCECGTQNTGNFCGNCGKPKPSTDWTCECGAVNSGNFCSNCGKPKP